MKIASPPDIPYEKVQHAKPLVFDFQRFSVNDGPGIRTNIYFKGCPLKCPWCHNPEGLSFDIEKSRDGKETYGKFLTVDEIVTECLKDIDYYINSNGGVTFTGGDPIAQVDWLVKIGKKLKEYPFNLAIESSGYAPVAEYRKLLGIIDYWLIDHKHTPKGYPWMIGFSYDRVYKVLEMLHAEKQRVWLRVPIIPIANDSQDRFLDIIKLVKKFENIEWVEILPYHNFGVNKAKKISKVQKEFIVPPEEQVKEWLSFFYDRGIKNVRHG